MHSTSIYASPRGIPKSCFITLLVDMPVFISKCAQEISERHFKGAFVFSIHKQRRRGERVPLFTSFYCWNRVKPFLPYKISRGKIIISIFPFRKHAFTVQTCFWGHKYCICFNNPKIHKILPSHFSVSEIRLRLIIKWSLKTFEFFQRALRLLLLATRGQ